MKYTVQGFRGKKFRNLVAFAQVYIDLLKLNKSKNNLFIVADKGADSLGRAIDPGFGEYIIFLKPDITVQELCQTLAHEMVHVKQYAKGQLQVKNLGVKWCGKMYKYSDNISYVNRPWEIEAMKKETILHYTAQERLA